MNLDDGVIFIVLKLFTETCLCWTDVFDILKTLIAFSNLLREVARRVQGRYSFSVPQIYFRRSRNHYRVMSVGDRDIQYLEDIVGFFRTFGRWFFKIVSWTNCFLFTTTTQHCNILPCRRVSTPRHQELKYLWVEGWEMSLGA